MPRGGARPGAGRPKGSKNALTSSMRDLIHEAFIDAGGAKYLKQVAVSHPPAFLRLLSKLVPPDKTCPECGKSEQAENVTIVFRMPERGDVCDNPFVLNSSDEHRDNVVDKN